MPSILQLVLSLLNTKVGVRDLVARGNFIPGRTSQRGVVGHLRSVSHAVGPRQGSGLDDLGWVPLGHRRARQGLVRSHMAPYYQSQSGERSPPTPLKKQGNYA